jgi:hypothetical protein
MILDYQWTLAPEKTDEASYFPIPMPIDGVPMDVKRWDET